MHDVIIAGAGPAGLCSAIYAARAGLKTLVFEKQFSGGQAAISPEIDNYPGFERVSGLSFPPRWTSTRRVGARL